LNVQFFRKKTFVHEGAEPFQVNYNTSSLRYQTQSSDFEIVQVANYGIGGVYNHHTDSGDNFLSEPREFTSDGDRVSTFMGYLTDVQAGGATVFPALGITSWPKRGSAIFW